MRCKHWIATASMAILFSAALLAQSPDAKPDACKHTVTGDLEIFNFSSKIFNNTRRLRVFLPPGYNDAANKDRKYPVLYMLDGQNLFDGCTAFDHVHEWEIDETITRLVNQHKIDPVIVVGVDNAQEKRADEYLPWKDDIQNPGMEQPHGNLLPEFFFKELMPAMAAKYRIETNKPGYAAIGGSSYGGVAALYVSLMLPTVFTKVIAESPVLWVGNGELIRQTKPLPVGPERLFLGFGGREFPPEAPARASASARELLSQLEANYRSAMMKPTVVLNVFDPEAHHQEAAWAKRFPQAIEFLFPAGELDRREAKPPAKPAVHPKAPVKK